MVQPKPVSLTQIDAEDYDGAFEPQPLLVVGPVPGGGGGGGGSSIQSADGSSGVVAIDGGYVSVSAASETNVTLLLVGNLDSTAALLRGPGNVPLDSSDFPSGIVVHADLAAYAGAADLDNVFTTLNERVPAPPLSGTYTLQSVNGVVSWVSA